MQRWTAGVALVPPLEKRTRTHVIRASPRYRDRKGALRAKFAADTFAVAATRPVAVARDADGAGVSLRLAAPDMDVGMSVDKFEVLLYELEQVQGVIAGMEGS